jgi:glycosyltransferase involved in cell wall biosynthesis
MDVLVCGAQVPFTTGGAELAQESLVTAIRAAGHRCELVRLPAAWDRVRILDAPLAWRMVPLDADVVVSTNFPSYFARHPRKVVWLFHQHRAAYDAVEQPWSDFGSDDSSLEAQRLLTEWDSRALSEAQRIFTISNVVADRLARYNGLLGTPLYHPPPLHDRLHGGSFSNYVFCPTRLAENKRPHLVLEGAAAASPVRVVLAGEGPLAGSLRDLAKDLKIADRVELPGFVPDDQLIDLYANAFAVVYAPMDEDYGYVTLQAFLAGKPVITASDSGGVLEWVEDGVTGLVTDGTPAGIGRAIDRLVAAPRWAHELGQAGRERVASLAWQPVVERLLGE